ncbi:MAG: hypothetical protein IKK49_01510 [Clostridia bacterium]|nr:hypothetical protein [Clostridia bacterium]
MAILRFLLSFLVTLGILSSPGASFTPLEDREFTDGEINVIDSDNEYIKMEIADVGSDIFNPDAEKGGYRYGPTLFVNADGSIDAFFACPGRGGQWDWISYRHSPDGGKTWTDEKSVLQPTPDSPDFYSCCDPGVVKFGEYYYIGYTSTVNVNGTDNNVFVARSKNIDGPYEKWNGNGWGGRPEAIIDFTGNPDRFGAGEPSFVVLGDTLYFYYTWLDDNGRETRVSVADATDENWPATLEYKGVAITAPDSSCDSADVKYVDDYGKFIAVATNQRFTADSFVDVFVSDDGITFERSYAMKTDTAICCHNCGISGRPNGHIRLSDGVYFAYAYGDVWANWPTRLSKVELSLIAAPDLSDIENENLNVPVTYAEEDLYANYIGIVCKPAHYAKSVGDGAFFPEILLIEDSMDTVRLLSGVTFEDYDESVVKFVGTLAVPQGVGETYVTVKYRDMQTQMFVEIQ